MNTADHPLCKERRRRNLSQDALAAACGVSKRTIVRAEQGESLNPASRQQICQYLRKSPEALGLLPTTGLQDDQLPLAGGILLSEINEMKRRELLRLLGLLGGALVLPFDIDWERMGDALAHPSYLDQPVLDDFVILNRQLWLLFRAAPSKSVVLDRVLNQLEVLTLLLHGSCTASQHAQLCSLASDLAQLAGEVFFDQNLYADAAQCYVFAEAAAREAKHYDLWSCALVRHAFLPIYDKQHAQALPLLHLAGQLARRGDSTLVSRYWVAAVSAEAYAGAGDLVACQRELDLADGVREFPRGNNGAWLRFDGGRLPEERGACFVKLQQLDLAEPALQQALMLQSQPNRRRGMILSDLAALALQKDEIEQACAYASEVVALAGQGSGVLRKNLFSLQEHFIPYRQVPVVRALHQQIQTVVSFK